VRTCSITAWDLRSLSLETKCLHRHPTFQADRTASVTERPPWPDPSGCSMFAAPSLLARGQFFALLGLCLTGLIPHWTEAEWGSGTLGNFLLPEHLVGILRGNARPWARGTSSSTSGVLRGAFTWKGGWRLPSPDSLCSQTPSLILPLRSTLCSELLRFSPPFFHLFLPLCLVGGLGGRASLGPRLAPPS